MEQIEIENAILEIMTECEMFTEDSPITYMIFLDRYKKSLSEIQIDNLNKIIENFKCKVNIITNLNFKKISMEQCSPTTPH